MIPRRLLMDSGGLSTPSRTEALDMHQLFPRRSHPSHPSWKGCRNTIGYANMDPRGPWNPIGAVECKPGLARGFSDVFLAFYRDMHMHAGSSTSRRMVFLLMADDRRFSRCGIDSHSSLSASAFSRNTDALCEGIFRPRGPKATLLLTAPHRLIASRGSAELPGRRVQWLSALPRDNGKNTSHWSLRVPGTPSRTCMPL